MITSKIDRLTADQQVVLKFASVIGKYFHFFSFEMFKFKIIFFLGMSFSVEFLWKLLPNEQISTMEQLENDLTHLETVCFTIFCKKTKTKQLKPIQYI